MHRASISSRASMSHSITAPKINLRIFQIGSLGCQQQWHFIPLTIHTREPKIFLTFLREELCVPTEWGVKLCITQKKYDVNPQMNDLDEQANNMMNLDLPSNDTTLKIVQTQVEFRELFTLIEAQVQIVLVVELKPVVDNDLGQVAASPRWRPTNTPLNSPMNPPSGGGGNNGISIPIPVSFTHEKIITTPISPRNSAVSTTVPSPRNSTASANSTFQKPISMPARAPPSTPRNGSFGTAPGISSPPPASTTTGATGSMVTPSNANTTNTKQATPLMTAGFNSPSGSPTAAQQSIVVTAATPKPVSATTTPQTQFQTQPTTTSVAASRRTQSTDTGSLSVSTNSASSLPRSPSATKLNGSPTTAPGAHINRLLSVFESMTPPQSGTPNGSPGPASSRSRPTSQDFRTAGAYPPYGQHVRSASGSAQGSAMFGSTATTANALTQAAPVQQQQQSPPQQQQQQQQPKSVPAAVPLAYAVPLQAQVVHQYQSQPVQLQRQASPALQQQQPQHQQQQYQPQPQQQQYQPQPQQQQQQQQQPPQQLYASTYDIQPATLTTISPLTTISTTSTPPPAVATGASNIPSQFLLSLKSRSTQLAEMFLEDKFIDLIGICESEIKIFEYELSIGVLQGYDKDRASNGVLLYLFHLSLAYTSLNQYINGTKTSEKFIKIYEMLPQPLARALENTQLYVQLLYNTGLGREKQGDIQGGIDILLKATKMIEGFGNAGNTSATSSASSSTSAPSSTLIQNQRLFSHCSDIYSSLGVLYTKQKSLEQAIFWHERALKIDSELPREERRWMFYHLASNTYAKKNEFKRVIQLDNTAIELGEEAILAAAKQGLLADVPILRLYYNRGIALQKLSQFRESLYDFTKVIDSEVNALQKEYPKSFIFRAKARMQDNEWNLAIEDCKVALRLLPGDAQATEYLQYIQQHTQFKK